MTKPSPHKSPQKSFKESFDSESDFYDDWTHSGYGIAVFDTSWKVAGASSLQLRNSGSIFRTPTMTHNTFSEAQAQVIGYFRRQNTNATIYVIHGSYGAATLPSPIGAWYEYRVKFWYDANADIRWSSVERWSAGAWISDGADVNHGAGAPSDGTIAIRGRVNSIYSAWFDELDVSE